MSLAIVGIDAQTVKLKAAHLLRRAIIIGHHHATSAQVTFLIA